MRLIVPWRVAISLTSAVVLPSLLGHGCGTHHSQPSSSASRTYMSPVNTFKALRQAPNSGLLKLSHFELLAKARGLRRTIAEESSQ